jgi:hypothetical protein
MHDAVQAGRPRGRDLGTVRSSCMVDDGARYFLISSIRNGLNGRPMMTFRRLPSIELLNRVEDGISDC